MKQLNVHIKQGSEEEKHPTQSDVENHWDARTGEELLLLTHPDHLQQIENYVRCWTRLIPVLVDNQSPRSSSAR